jgi:CRISPR-associated protein (TIGR03984 family)
MTALESPLALAGCELASLDSSTCERYVSWLLGDENTPTPEGATGLVWALAHCDDGVTWGRYDQAARAWRLGNQVAPGVSPPIRPETLQELRLFGEDAEVLIWRTDAGLRGRVLRHSDFAADRDDAAGPLRPLDESRIVRGSLALAQCEHGFTHIGDGTGAEQVLPIEVSDEQLRAARIRLVVRHYFEADGETGTVRIAATRLVRLASLASGGGHGT